MGMPVGNSRQTDVPQQVKAARTAFRAIGIVLIVCLTGLAATVLSGQLLIAWVATAICVVVGLWALWMVRPGRYSNRDGLLSIVPM
ncbi:MAG: hypothetical protein VB934_08425, partial [Polyangiaceae bacterium]